MNGPLLCVGGPLDKQMRQVPPGARCLIIHHEPESWLLDAYMDSSKAAEIPNTVTIREAVYKVVPLGYDSFQGVSLRIEVLAYFGSKAADRPNGFYL